MQFYTTEHDYYCGIDLHARTMYVCIIDSKGKIVTERNMPSAPEPLLAFIAPYRSNLVVGVECIFTWYWLADLCAREQLAFVLGHALYMKAIHGGKVKNDRIDAQKIAALLRSGMFPQAYVYPAEMRATRDLMRRRNHLMRKRAELLSHIQNTNSQYNLPVFGRRISEKADRHRLDLAERFADPQVKKSIEFDCALIDFYDEQLPKLEWHIQSCAKEHDPKSLAILKTVPGIGNTLALIILYEIHDVSRFARVQDFMSYSRLVKCSRESAGKLYGHSGSKIGNVHLKWAFSESAVTFLRGNEQGQKLHQRLVKKHGKGKALSILAAKIGRAVYFMLSRERVFDKDKFFAG
jgi:transposase